MRKEKMFAVFALLALSLAGAAHAATPNCPGTLSVQPTPWYCSQISQATANIWYQWAPIALITAMLALLLGVMIFIAGTSMRSEKLKNFGIGEMYEALATMLIAVAFLFLSAILFGIIPTFITGPINPYNTSLTYISNIISGTQYLVTSMYNVIMLDSYYSSIAINVQIGTAGAYEGTGSGLAQWFNAGTSAIFSLFIIPAQAVSGLLTDGLLALYAEFYFILFFMYTAIPVFLIPGIIMRAIFPLRSVGGLLIAVAIAFFLIMPILFSVAYTLTIPGAMQQLTMQSALISAEGAGSLSQTNAECISCPLVTTVQGVQNSMGGYFLSVLFYPALILALSYISMNIIAEFIGGATQTTKRMGLI